MSLILGLIFSSYTELDIIFSDLDYLLAFFVKLTGFFSFCLFLGILVKRSAFALGFLLVWNIIEAIIRGYLAFTVFPDSDTDEKITQFLPLESMANLIVNPGPRLSIVKNIGTQMGINTDIDYSVSYFAILIVLIWTFLFVYFSYKLLKNRDL
jgi:hypothetical protein